MKSLLSKVLPLLFVAMLSLAPTNAQAAGPTNGMFDCLGDQDWGCRVIGFLFQTTDNDLIFTKDGQPSAPEAQPIAAKAMHAMMEFFSNVLLIFASIKLLYELIQMTAESAKTGQVGGKDTNTLWAPIRLVVAIGLLVPLADSGGLNSGQLIILQIAKWGSGAASQAWKVFTQKFADERSSLAVPPAPRIQNLAYTTSKIFACMWLVNFYANETGATNSIVTEQREEDDNSLRYVYKNRVHNDICGVIRNTIPLSLTSTRDPDAQRALDYANQNWAAFVSAKGEISDEANNMIQTILPTGRNFPRANTRFLAQIIDRFQSGIDARVSSSNSIAQAAMAQIINEIQTSANTQGWTSAGSLFLRITRAQSQIINGALNIPEAVGPNVDILRQRYGSAYRDYMEFTSLLDSGAITPSSNSAPTTGSPTTASRERLNWLDFLKAFGQNVLLLQDPAEELFRFLDSAAIAVGLWDPDPRKAFGDLGSSNNPFGEIAALGHKKIRLALNYFSYALVASAGGAVVGVLLSSVGGFISGLAPILMFIAALFLLAGVALAYVVPMLPFTRFFFSILTWIGSLIEAMVLVPFMALAFLTPKGEGFSGPNTRNAFFLVFQLFLRPILCLLGLIGAMILFYVAAKFLNAVYYEATSHIYMHDTGSAMRFMQKLVYSVMYVGLIYSAANVSFKMIEHFPKHALKWMGGSASEESYDDHNSFLGVAGAVGGTQLLNQFQSIPQNLMSPATKAMEAYKAGKSSNSAKKNHQELLNALSSRNGGDGSSGRSSGGSSLLGSGGDDTPPPPPGGSGGMAIATNNQTTPEQMHQAEQEHHRIQVQAESLQSEIEQDANMLAGIDPNASVDDAQRYASLSQSIQRKVNALAGLGVPARIPNNAALAAHIPRPSVEMNPVNRPEQAAQRVALLRRNAGTSGSGDTTT